MTAATGLTEALETFAVPDPDAEPLLAAAEAVCGDAALHAWVQQQAARLTSDPGLAGPSALEPAPDCSDSPDVVRRYLPVLVFAAALPGALARHRDLGIDADVARATFADVGRNLVVNRRWEGEPGLGDELTGWLTRHLAGRLFALGRLQFERAGVGRTTAGDLTERGIPCQKGDPVLFVHIPAYCGPLTPASCDASFAHAERFFARHFPDERHRALLCFSWLLDPQLEHYLAPDSNVLAFQRRFSLWQRHVPDFDADASIRKFVFEQPRLPDDRQPRRTRLERAVVDHVATGGHWQLGRGWIRGARD